MIGEETEFQKETNIPKNLLNSIYPGDCLGFLNKIPDESIDLVVSSPPYNIGKTINDRQPLEQYLDWQKEVLTECNRVLKHTGSIFWEIGAYIGNDGAHIPLDIKFFPIFEDLGMIPRNRIIWIRPHGMHAKNKFSGRHETILWFTKTMDYKFFLDPIKVPQKYDNKKHWKGEKKGEYSCDPKGKNVGDVWAFRNVRHNHEEDTIHPSQFPEDLIERIILATTEPYDVVLDPFMGTGTTAVVAKRFNRYFCGAEIDKKYVAIANQRISGLPDENNNFPNLKTLREYVKTNRISDASQFTFTRQREGSLPSLDSKAYPEQHHCYEIIERIKFEADNANYKKIEEDSDIFK
jgi:adenine-specific DNA-methyltransferase